MILVTISRERVESQAGSKYSKQISAINREY